MKSAEYTGHLANLADVDTVLQRRSILPRSYWFSKQFLMHSRARLVPLEYSSSTIANETFT